MKKNSRFYIGLVGVALVVTYLIWTGVSDAMVYYLTPQELLARVSTDPSLHEVGLKVSGRVVPGSYQPAREDEPHRFVVSDLENSEVTFPVVYEDLLPDTFTDEVEVVLEGRYGPDGVFEAVTVLTKCGSRYEATPEELST
jgi:cytochrome c-type biogenesis protein CcmE